MVKLIVQKRTMKQLRTRNRMCKPGYFRTI